MLHEAFVQVCGMAGPADAGPQHGWSRGQRRTRTGRSTVHYGSTGQCTCPCP